MNKHGVPGFSMGFNVVCMIALVFTGGAVEIYTLSNVGYTVSFVPVLIGYYLLRRYRPEMRRPFRLPEFFKYLALVLAASTSSSGSTAESSSRHCPTHSSTTTTPASTT